MFHFLALWARSGVVVCALDFRSEGRWCEAQSVPSCCVLREDTLPHIVSTQKGTVDILLGVKLCEGLAFHPGGSSNTFSCFLLQKPSSAPTVWASLACVRLDFPWFTFKVFVKMLW